jgi:hypothetical protein
VSVTDEWAQAEPYLRDQAYREMEARPEFLFDCEGGPEGMQADIILGRLVGHDDQFIRDIRLDRAVPVWLEPMFPRMAFTAAPAEGTGALPDIRAAEYGLRSSYALIELDSQTIWPPAGVTLSPANGYRYTVLFLRYKRRV